MLTLVLDLVSECNNKRKQPIDPHVRTMTARIAKGPLEYTDLKQSIHLRTQLEQRI